MYAAEVFDAGYKPRKNQISSATILKFCHSFREALDAEINVAEGEKASIRKFRPCAYEGRRCRQVRVAEGGVFRLVSQNGCNDRLRGYKRNLALLEGRWQRSHKLVVLYRDQGFEELHDFFSQLPHALMLQTGDTHEVSAEDWRNNATSQKVGLPATVVM